MPNFRCWVKFEIKFKLTETIGRGGLFSADNFVGYVKGQSKKLLKRLAGRGMKRM